MTNWVTIKKFEALTGYTEDAVRAKISQAVWLEGKVWKRAPDGKPRVGFLLVESPELQLPRWVGGGGEGWGRGL